jgi:hypothetical protein
MNCEKGSADIGLRSLCILWACHEKSPEVVGRDGRVKLRMRTMLLLSAIPVSHIQTHVKSSTYSVFVHVTTCN